MPLSGAQPQHYHVSTVSAGVMASQRAGMKAKAPAISTDADTGPANSLTVNAEALALHEIVGWLLGAVFAMFNPQNVDQVPTLLSEHQQEEFELLRATLKHHVPSTQQALVYKKLLCGLHNYCCISYPFKEPEWPSDANSSWLLNAFFSQVMDIVEQRRILHDGFQISQCGLSSGSRPITQMKSCPNRLPRSRSRVTSNGSNVTAHRECDSPSHTRKRIRTDANGNSASKVENAHIDNTFETTSSKLAVIVNEKPGKFPSGPSAGGMGAAGGKQNAIRPGSDRLRRTNTSTCQDDSNDIKEEWPDGNGTCEGCGRFTYGCEAWSKACVILCASCRKARAPMIMALASECLRIHSIASMGGA